MTRCGRTSELPESSRAEATLAVTSDAVNILPVAVVGDVTNNHRLLDMENTICELADRNQELKQQFNRRAQELEDTSA